MRAISPGVAAQPALAPDVAPLRNAGEAHRREARGPAKRLVAVLTDVVTR